MTRIPDLGAINPFEWHEVGSSTTCRTLVRFEVDPTTKELIFHEKVEIRDPQGFADVCKEDRDQLTGKKWGDGQVIGRVPDAMYYKSGMAEARRNGDEKWIRRFWNDPDNAKLRVMPGRV